MIDSLIIHPRGRLMYVSCWHVRDQVYISYDNKLCKVISYRIYTHIILLNLLPFTWTTVGLLDLYDDRICRYLPSGTE